MQDFWWDDSNFFYVCVQTKKPVKLLLSKCTKYWAIQLSSSVLIRITGYDGCFTLSESGVHYLFYIYSMTNLNLNGL